MKTTLLVWSSLAVKFLPANQAIFQFLSIPKNKLKKEHINAILVFNFKSYTPNQLTKHFDMSALNAINNYFILHNINKLCTTKIHYKTNNYASICL